LSKVNGVTGGCFWDSLQLPVLIGQLQAWVPQGVEIYIDTMITRDDIIVRACQHRHVHLEMGIAAGHGSMIAALLRAVALARVIATHENPPVALVQVEIRKILTALPDLLADAPPALRQFLEVDPNETPVTLPKGVQVH
jgi:hypothetical protein